MDGNGNGVNYLQVAADAHLIQVQINELRQHQEQVLRQDPEYAEYLDAHDERGDGQPLLGIIEFHRLQKELGYISRLFNSLNTPADGDQIEELWRQFRRRIVELERLLLG